MFAIGHFGLGYLIGKAFSKLLNVKLNLALVFTVTVLPDIDLLLFRFMHHRGPTHSLLFLVLVSLPFILVYKKKAIPYFAVLLTHSLIGDIFTGGIQLLWPLSNNWIYLADLDGRGIISIGMELALFVISTLVMVLNKDFKKYFFTKTINWIYWIIPIGSVLGPMLINTGDYGYLPTLLVYPSLFYLALFAYQVIGQTLRKINNEN